MVQAIRMALHYGETHLGVKDIFGEDVGPPLGGVFTATQGLKTSWNSPLDERGIIGAAMGLGLAGDRCVAERGPQRRRLRTDGGPSTGEHFRQGGSLAKRHPARISSHHARGYGHQRYPTRPRRCWRVDRRLIRNWCRLCFRWSRTSGSARRRPRRCNSSAINKGFRLNVSLRHFADSFDECPLCARGLNPQRRAFLKVGF